LTLYEKEKKTLFYIHLFSSFFYHSKIINSKKSNKNQTVTVLFDSPASLFTLVSIPVDPKPPSPLNVYDISFTYSISVG